MSAFGGVVGIIFGCFWTILAYKMTPAVPVAADSIFADIFPLFGVLFIIVGIVNVLYNLKNATARNRFSMVEVTGDNEEPDPLDPVLQSGTGGPAPGANSVEHRLAELESLQKQGLVRPDEYERKRADILNSL